MREVKEVFRKASAPVVTKVGWAAVFATYDTDGSGALDKEEFIGKSSSPSALPRDSSISAERLHVVLCLQEPCARTATSASASSPVHISTVFSSTSLCFPMLFCVPSECFTY